VHFVFSDLQHIEMLLAEPLEMTHVFFSDDVPFLECPAFELARSYLRDIMGKDRADGLLHGYGFCTWSLLLMNGITHGSLHWGKFSSKTDPE
jgi:hypothetical protein